MELTKASSEYVVLPNGFTGRMALISSFSSTVWINLKTVGSKHGSPTKPTCGRVDVVRHREVRPEAAPWVFK